MTVIFTIARLNGSGGREIARILSERLGIRSYDKELITETAKAAGITEDEVYAMEERQKKGGFYYYGLPDDNPMHRYQFDAIRALADRGESCVFVGRCSDSVLDGREGLVKVFISASMEKCIERSAQRNGISEKEACRPSATGK